MTSNTNSLFKIPAINSCRHYWMIRTNGGIFFDDFSLHQYVAISWDYVTLSMLNTMKEDTLKRIIDSNEKSNPTPDNDEDDDTNPKGTITTIYNKLHRFVFEIQKGDIVLIPSKNSDIISICEVTGDVYEDTAYVEKMLAEDSNSSMVLCPYHKRRKVQWLKSVNKSQADIYLIQGLNSQHALSCLDEYAPFIDRTLYSIYRKDNEVHTVIKAGRKSGISLKELARLINYLNNAVDDISNQCALTISEADVEVKLNIHSPGLIEIIGIGASAGIAISIVMFSINNFINGGKFKLSFKKDKDGNLDFSIESNSGGLNKHKEQEKEIDLKEKELLISMVRDMDIKGPEIVSALINNRELAIKETPNNSPADNVLDIPSEN